MLRIRPLRTALLSLRPRLPFWFRRWLATNWRQAAHRKTDQAQRCLHQAKALRADAQQITETAASAAEKEE